MRNLFKLSVIISLFLSVSIVYGADTPGPFDIPHPGGYTNSAYYDLDRNGDWVLDWTGWASYGWTYGHAYDNHSGTDWGMTYLTDIMAAADGTVYYVVDGVPRDDHSNSGNYIFLRHPQYTGGVWDTNYFHLEPGVGSYVTLWDDVTQGQHIAESDNTGNSTGPHLHWGVRPTGGSYSCPYHNGWWETSDIGTDRVQVNTGVLNVRTGNTTGYPAFTQIRSGQEYVAVESDGGWYRMFMPSQEELLEVRDDTGAQPGSPDYSESANGGTAWADSSAKSALTELVGTGSRFNDDTEYLATAQLVPDLPESGDYEVFVSWGTSGNAENVRYTVNFSGGSADWYLDQQGWGRDGTVTDPIEINASPYFDAYTTSGAPQDLWDTYNCSVAAEYGPERVYVLTTVVTGDITATCDSIGGGVDCDVHILNGPSNSNCIARADITVTASSQPAGTYYIVVDSYGNPGSPGAYELTVEYPSGDGTISNPIPIGESQYEHEYTTVGNGQDLWDTYSCSALNVNGREVIYELTTQETGDIYAWAVTTGSGADIDMYILDGPTNGDCIDRGDVYAEYLDAPAGTYYLVCESYGSGSEGEGAYHLMVTYTAQGGSESEHGASNAGVWHSIGTYPFLAGQSAVIGSVDIDETTVTGKPSSANLGRIYADSVRFTKNSGQFYGWASGTYLDVQTGTDPQILVKTAEMVIRSHPVGIADVVGRTYKGQRFIPLLESAGWFEVPLTGSDETGWIDGSGTTNLVLYGTVTSGTEVEGWEMY